MEFGFGMPTRGAVATVGVRHMMVNLQGDTLEQTLGRMQHFAGRIMPLTA